VDTLITTNVHQQNLKASPAVDTSRWSKKKRKTKEKLEVNNHWRSEGLGMVWEEAQLAAEDQPMWHCCVADVLQARGGTK